MADLGAPYRHRGTRAIQRMVEYAPATGGLRWLPGLQMLRSYRLQWLGSDLMAGLVLALVSYVPASIIR